MSDQTLRYRTVRERDIDLVLCVAASSIPAVASLFAAAEGLPVTKHSVSDRDGEVDVVLAWPNLEVHVENKVDAEFQPDQPERYERRSAGASVPTSTALLAPQSYIDSRPEGAAVFGAQVSYEQLASALESDTSPVSQELAVLVRRGVEQHRAGRPENYSDTTAGFFSVFEHRSVELGLPWQVVENDQSAGRGFYTLKQWDELAGRRVELSAKFNQHNKIDITVRDAAHVAETAAALWQGTGVFVRPTKSGALMIGRDTAVVHTDATGKERAERIDRVLDVAQAHITWWQTTGKQQLRVLLES